MVPTTCSVSEPPAPPSTLSIEAPLASTNVSALSAAPSSCSTSEKLTLPSDPAFAPVTFHVLSTAGPASVSVPPPPSKATAIAASRKEASIVSRSRWPPPRIEIPLTEAAARLSLFPFNVNAISLSDAPSETVLSASSARATVHSASTTAGADARGGRRGLDRSRCLGLCRRLLSGRCSLLGRGRSLLRRRRRFLGRGRRLLGRGRQSPRSPAQPLPSRTPFPRSRRPSRTQPPLSRTRLRRSRAQSPQWQAQPPSPAQPPRRGPDSR